MRCEHLIKTLTGPDKARGHREKGSVFSVEGSLNCSLLPREHDHVPTPTYIYIYAIYASRNTWQPGSLAGRGRKPTAFGGSLRVAFVSVERSVERQRLRVGAAGRGGAARLPRGRQVRRSTREAAWCSAWFGVVAFVAQVVFVGFLVGMREDMDVVGMREDMDVFVFLT